MQVRPFRCNWNALCTKIVLLLIRSTIPSTCEWEPRVTINMAEQPSNLPSRSPVFSDSSEEMAKDLSHAKVAALQLSLLRTQLLARPRALLLYTESTNKTRDRSFLEGWLSWTRLPGWAHGALHLRTHHVGERDFGHCQEDINGAHRFSWRHSSTGKGDQNKRGLLKSNSRFLPGPLSSQLLSDKRKVVAGDGQENQETATPAVQGRLLCVLAVWKKGSASSLKGI